MVVARAQVDWKGVPQGINMELAPPIYWEAYTILRRHCWCFAYAGQALAIVRQKQLFPHDKDTDLDFAALLFMEDDDNKLLDGLKEDFAKAGYGYNGYAHSVHEDVFRLQQLVMTKEGMGIDIVFYHPSSDGKLAIHFSDHGRKDYPLYLFESLSMELCETDGHHYPIPTPGPVWCHHAFGEGWVKPKVRKDPWPTECKSLRGGWDWP